MRLSSLAALTTTAVVALGTTSLSSPVTAAPAAAPNAPSAAAAGRAVHRGARRRRRRPHGRADPGRRGSASTLGHVYHSALQGYSTTMTPAVADLVAAAPGVTWVQRDRAVSIDAQTTPDRDQPGRRRREPDREDQRRRRAGRTSTSPSSTPASTSPTPTSTSTARAPRTARSVRLNANDDSTATAPTSPAPSARSTTAPAWSASPRAPGSGRSRCSRDAGTGLNSDVICGIDYVTAHADEIEVANMSLGGAGDDDGNCGATNDDAMHAAICESVAAGVTFVVAAGNDSADASDVHPGGVRRGHHRERAGRLQRPARWRRAVHLPRRRRRHVRRLLELRRRRRPDRPGRLHQLHLDARRLQHDLRHVDGQPARRGRCRALPRPRTRAPRRPQVKAALQASGTLDWNDVDDPDSIKERLLDVSTY